MANRAVRERLALDISTWLTDGLIDAKKHATLSDRYAAREFGAARVIRTLGIVGSILAALGVLGFIGVSAHSAQLAALICAGVSAGFFAAGIRLARDPLGLHVGSARTLIFLGLVATAGAVVLTLIELGVEQKDLPLFAGLIVAPIAFLIAYRYKNGFALLLATLLCFHWVGTWNRMLDRTTYALEMGDPRWMCVAALAAVGIGLWHSQRERFGRFHVIYEVSGLVYLNTSLLTLSLLQEHPARYALLLALGAVAQIVAGARLKNARLAGFGVTFFVLNGFTRFYEWFWDSLGKGLTFIALGLLLLAAGLFCERILVREPL